jgi:hypothetical protein
VRQRIAVLEVAAVQVVRVLRDEPDERGTGDPLRRRLVGLLGELIADRRRPPRPRAPVPLGLRRPLDQADLLERPQVPRAVRGALPHDRRALAGRARADGEDVVQQREARRDGERGKGLGAEHGARREVVARRRIGRWPVVVPRTI